MALPDDDRRVFSFTEGHGPAALDLAGMVLVGLGLAAYIVAVVQARSLVRRPDLVGGLALYLPGSALAGWSVATDTGWWWALGVAVALAGQAVLARRIFAGTPRAPLASRPATGVTR